MYTDLISKQYKHLNLMLHRSRHGFGGSGWRWAGIVCSIIHEHGIRSMLDYGCGQGTLWRELRKVCPVAASVKYYEYDPCIPGKDAMPSPADLVTCTDVLEHIEPDRLPAVIHHIVGLSKRAIFLNIAQHAANTILPDGRNAHLTVQPNYWWAGLIQSLVGTSWAWRELESPRPLKDYNVLLFKG